MATPVTLKLTTVDLPTLCEALLTVASKWYVIGLQMNIPSSTLDIIKVDRMNEGVQACFIEMLKIWLKSLQHPTPSWPNLIAVLRTKSVGESQLAAQLEKEYCPHLQVSEDHTLVQLPQSDSSNDEWNLIEVLCQEFKIDLNEKCNTEVFLQMKAFFDWQVISPHLNIDVLDIAKESSTEEEKCWKTLQRWRETSGDGATYHTLTKAMLKAGKIDQVFRVLKEIFKIIDKNDSEIEGKMVLLQQYLEGSVGSTPSFHTADDIENEQWENLCQLPKLEEAVPQAVMNTEHLTDSPHIVVSPNDVGQLAEQLNDIAGEWELFLSQLKVPQTKRNQIKLQRTNNPSYAQLCLLDGLEFWVTSDDSPTYEKIANALRSDVIKNTKLALKIEQMQETKVLTTRDSMNQRDHEASGCRMTLQDPRVDVEEHRSPCNEMTALTSTYPRVYEQVEQDFQAMDNLSESFLLASTPEDSDQNAERDILSNTVNGYSPTSDHDQINDRNDNESRIMENMEPLVERTAANGTTEFDLDDLTDTSPLLSDHGTEHEHRMFEDDSTIRSVGLCRKMLTRYCLCHEKICQSIETRKLKCKCFVGVVGSASLITSVVFMMVLLISGSNYLVRDSFFAVPNYPVIVGFDPYYVSRVELHTDIESDLHKVSYYVRTVPKCSLLSTRNFSVNSSAERLWYVSEAISNFDSNYLLPGSEITYNLNLDSVSSTNCSAMVYIFDDVNAHLRLIYQSDVLGAIDSICLSNGSANFTVIASKPSHYVVDIQFNEPYPTSVLFTVSGVIFYYDITYLSPSNIVPGVTPFDIITWTGGIVMKKETRSTCVIVFVHDMPGDKPDTFLKINYTAKRTFLQNAQDLAFLILCVLSAMPFIIIVLFGIYLYMYVLLVRCFGKGI